MQKMLVLYSSREGHTKKIIDRMFQDVTAWQIELHDLHHDMLPSPEKYDQLLIAASIRYGHFHPNLNKYIKKHAELLKEKRWSFLAVNLVARKKEKDTPETNPYTRKWLAQTTVKPTMTEVIAGALQYSKYNWWQTLIIQLIMWMTGGDTDKSKDIEFTNWEKVQKFTEQLLKY